MRQCGFDGFVEPEVSTVAKVDEVITQKVVVPTIASQTIIPTVVTTPAVIDVIKDGAPKAAATPTTKAGVNNVPTIPYKNPLFIFGVTALVLWAVTDFKSFKRFFV